jgi:hypothetical protein
MSFDDILIDRVLPVERNATTFITRRAVKKCMGWDWFGFDGRTELDKRAVARLRAQLATAIPMQKGFSSFNLVKFSDAWKAIKPKIVDHVYEAVWQGF